MLLELDDLFDEDLGAIPANLPEPLRKSRSMAGLLKRDGIFYNHIVLKGWQKVMGLPPTGLYDARSAAALKKLVPYARPAFPAKLLQGKAMSQGMVGLLKRDGINYNPHTLRLWQTRIGLPATGLYDKRSAAVLKRLISQAPPAFSAAQLAAKKTSFPKPKSIVKPTVSKPVAATMAVMSPKPVPKLVYKVESLAVKADKLATKALKKARPKGKRGRVKLQVFSKLKHLGAKLPRSSPTRMRVNRKIILACHPLTAKRIR